MIGIYKITNPIGEVYIGMSANIPKRWKSYKCLSNSGQPKLYDSFLSYGVEKHVFEVIEECEKDNLSEREKYWQQQHDCFESGLNVKSLNDYKRIHDVLISENERNAGRKPKFLKGGKMIAVQLRVPEKGRETIMKAVDETINQFKEYDWT